MEAADPYARTIRQAAHDAVRALLTTAPDSPEGSAARRDAVEVADRWFHDQPAPDVPGPAAGR